MGERPSRVQSGTTTRKGLFYLCQYLHVVGMTEKADSKTCANFLITESPSAERLSQVQSSSRVERSEWPERSTILERSSWVKGSSSTEISSQLHSSSAERSTLYTLASPSDRSRSFGITSSHPTCQENNHDCESDKTLGSEFHCPISDVGLDSDNDICDTGTENNTTSHLQRVSSQTISHGDDETGEASHSFSSSKEHLPSKDHLSNQSAYSDMDIITTSSSNHNDLHSVADNYWFSSSASSASASASSSSSVSSPRKSFSISSATASSSSKPVKLSVPTEVSKPLLDTEASSSSIPMSSTQSPKQTFSISVSSSTSSTAQMPNLLGDFSQPEVVSEPMLGFPRLIVNRFEIPTKKEKSSNADCSTLSKSCEDECDTVNSIFNFKIPSYLLIQIFQHLSMYELLHNVSSVCKLWYTISHDPDLWRVIDLRNQLKVTDVVITNLTSYSDRVIYLNISDIGTISEDCLVQTVKTCIHLSTIILSRCMSVATNKVLAAIGEHCHNLRNIHLEVCYKITDAGFKDLAVGCPKLESVHISQCTNIGDKGLACLGEHCPLLERLSVDSCVKVQNEGIIALANGCPELRVINLHSSSIGDVGAYQLHKLKFLRTLDLSGSNELSLRTVCAITQNCSQLVCLNLSLNQNVDDRCMETVALHCTNLKKLYLVSCNITDTGLEFLGRHSRSLEHLDIGWCHSVTDAGVQFVSERCTALRYIGLIRCDQVTADGIEKLVDKYPRVTYSTFILESRKIIEMARNQGFQFPVNSDNEKPNFLSLRWQTSIPNDSGISLSSSSPQNKIHPKSTTRQSREEMAEDLV
ncbi:F-box/LRR-repeat protein 17 [Mizuhopecten yessoensis]|uniref:F-box/LRR-repeat protein 17 n=1 Tax=Mizuhopecten yessoensis TaxID=6573 RepID=A0A210PY03_MIZYE|nr:F-box/LRR-repeat protein 17 [Mizuhopecten yessoensis]